MVCQRQGEARYRRCFFLDDMRLSITIKGYARGEWGKTIFATQEEAQKKIESENI